MPHRKLVMTEKMFETLQEHLLKTDGKERFCFAYGGKVETEGIQRFYIHELDIPEDEDYVRHSPTWVEPRPEWVFRALKHFGQSEASCIFQIHSHPFSQAADFSAWDDESYERNRDDCLRSKPEGIYIRLVWGCHEDGFTAEFYDSTTDRLVGISALTIVGVRGIQKIERNSRSFLPDSPERPDRISEAFSRHVEWLGEAGQRLIGETILGCCGVGGIGNVWVTLAMHCGFRRFILVDDDPIEMVNLNRLIGSHKGVLGKNKATFLKSVLKRFNSDIEVEVIEGRIEDRAVQHALLRADVLVNGFDNNAARLEAQVFAARHLKPMLDMGSQIFLTDDRQAVSEMGAQMRFYIPGEPCLGCQGLPVEQILSESLQAARQAAGYIDGMPPEYTPGSVITLNTAIACLGIDNLLRYVTGFLPPQMTLIYDALQHTCEERRFERRSSCPICGEEGIEGLGEEMVAEVALAGDFRPHVLEGIPHPSLDAGDEGKEIRAWEVWEKMSERDFDEYA